MFDRRAATSILIGCLVVACNSGATQAPASIQPTPVVTAPASPSSAPTSTPSPGVESTAPSTTPAPTASVEPTAVPTPTATATPTATPSVEPLPTMVVRAYFLLNDRSGGDPAIVPVLRTVPVGATTARPGLDGVLGGPSAREAAATPRVRTFIPDGTDLRSIRIANGIATVDLSGAFLATGDAFSVRARLAQIVFTATQDASVDRVIVHVDGKPIGSGPGWTVARDPMTRTTFRDVVVPVIFVDRPAWGATYASGTDISGLANVFEAQFSIGLRDASGTVIAERAVTASSGSGSWGRWTTSLRYEVTKAQWGELRVWDVSEATGTVTDLRVYPVWLRP